MSVKECLSWFELMLKSPAKERKHWLKTVIAGVRATVMGGKRGKLDRKELSELADFLESRDCEIIGFAPNLQYIRIEGPNELLNNWWVHAFSSPTIVAKHKRLPIVFLVNPSLRLDESTVFELGSGGRPKQADIIGYTG